MNRVLALILAGGQGSRLSILAEERAKPAVPFAGKYRIIDFTLSNCVNSGIFQVGVLTQYRPRSLNEHIGVGRPWGLDRERGVILLQPYRDRSSGDWYKGTADAVYQNLYFVEESRAEQVLILAGDHVYKMRYDELVGFHRAKGADVTVGLAEVSWEEASRFGLVVLDENDAVVGFEEKPPAPRGRLASMGIYVFSPRVLCQVLEEYARKIGSSHDFGRDILPAMVAHHYRVFGYRFCGYWRDVGTVDSYWEANMEFLEEPPPMDLDSGEERIRTLPQDRPPAKLGPRAVAQQSLLCHGSIIYGSVCHSVLSQGVVVEEGAMVEDSILFDDVIVKRGAVVRRSVVDKEVVVGEDAIVGYGDDNTPNEDEPLNLYTGLTLVGKRAVMPAGVRIGRNCKIMPGVAEGDFPPARLIPSGSNVVKTTTGEVDRLLSAPI